MYISDTVGLAREREREKCQYLKTLKLDMVKYAGYVYVHVTCTAL